MRLSFLIFLSSLDFGREGKKCFQSLLELALQMWSPFEWGFLIEDAHLNILEIEQSEKEITD
ncbi:hypothetical protein Scep_026046 [Stephania cephalantha]|uniref:Uncharacterized protein n=1 Tax=Stephania cephalantha TaxID=152367 RepID=A0AAP0EPM7_9MAGN